MFFLLLPNSTRQFFLSFPINGSSGEFIDLIDSSDIVEVEFSVTDIDNISIKESSYAFEFFEVFVEHSSCSIFDNTFYGFGFFDVFAEDSRCSTLIDDTFDESIKFSSYE